VAHEEEGSLNDLRAILGNDIAIKASREGKLPFPDGTIIARLAWSYDPAVSLKHVEKIGIAANAAFILRFRFELDARPPSKNGPPNRGQPNALARVLISRRARPVPGPSPPLR
jgi:cytochrome P460